jgi:hypothetical protein
MRLETWFTCNAVILLSAPRTGEEGTPRRIAEDLDAISKAKGDFIFRHQRIDSATALADALTLLKAECEGGLRPIIHFDMHGDKITGLEIGRTGEMVGWDALIEKLRPINVATENNLCVLVTACHGLYLIRPISIFEPTPFFALIAPQEEIKFSDVDGAVTPFYRELIETGHLDAALPKLSDRFKYFHSEKMLVISMAKYIRAHCTGKGAVKRREELLTGAFRHQPSIPNTKANRKLIRKKIKKHIEPDQELLTKYAAQFLIGKPMSVTMADIRRDLAHPSTS